MSYHDDLFELIAQLVMRHSPSGVEASVDELLIARFEQLGVEAWSDPAENIIARIPGSGECSVAITAHKDEIGAIVTNIDDGGRLKVKKVGGSYPWVYGEGVVDLLGDKRLVSGVLSFGSRHVSHLSPQHAFKEGVALKWSDCWIETKLRPEQLAEAGVRVGTRMVVGKHRKAPYRLGDYVASYTLDNKASLAIVLELAKRLKKPIPDVYILASAKEEVGAVGALYFSQHQKVDAVIALEICPIAPENPIVDGPVPVLLEQDEFGVYDNKLNMRIAHRAKELGLSLQHAAISGFGSDGSFAMKAGHVPRAACLGFPTQNTHGFEIAHLGAIENCIQLLDSLCTTGQTWEDL